MHALRVFRGSAVRGDYGEPAAATAGSWSTFRPGATHHGLSGADTPGPVGLSSDKALKALVSLAVLGALIEAVQAIPVLYRVPACSTGWPTAVQSLYPWGTYGYCE